MRGPSLFKPLCNAAAKRVGKLIAFAMIVSFISRCAGNIALCPAHPFVVVWIMYIVFHGACAPRKSGVALGAPHLVAARDFENKNMAFGAGFGIASQEFGGGNEVGVANVVAVAFGAFDDMACGACPEGTKSAFPLGAEEPAAAVGGTTAHEFGGSSCGIKFGVLAGRRIH